MREKVHLEKCWKMGKKVEGKCGETKARAQNVEQVAKLKG